MPRRADSAHDGLIEPEFGDAPGKGKESAMTHRGQEDFPERPYRRNDAIQPGDRVCTGANVHPNHEVIAVHRDKAWVRDLRTGCDGITSLSRCHKA
jgi:hypothetical protein